MVVKPEEVWVGEICEYRPSDGPATRVKVRGKPVTGNGRFHPHGGFPSGSGYRCEIEHLESGKREFVPIDALFEVDEPNQDLIM